MDYFEIDCDRIVDRLYQGSAPTPGRHVADLGFDVLVLAATENQRPELYPDVEVICAPGEDDCRVHRMERYLPIWKEAGRSVVSRWRDGKKVLVTCLAGLNRSGMVTAFALHELTGWSGTDVVEHIRASRHMALFNETFAKYLIGNLKQNREDLP